MASLTKDRRLIFKAPDGNRKTIRLGKLPVKHHATVHRHVERLLACHIDGSAPPPETTHWIQSLSEGMHAKLVNAGLVEPKGIATGNTLGRLIEAYKLRPKWEAAKEATRVFHGKAFRHILNHFGPDQPIRTLNEAEAEDFHAWLMIPKPKGAGLAKSTANRTCSTAWSLCRYAIRSRVIDRNPFDEVPRGNVAAKECGLVTTEDSLLVLDEMPDTEHELLFALSRWGGLRVPSEPRQLRWSHIDWENDRFLVTSPKTERHEGHESRWVPIFPELAKLFDQRFTEAAEGDEFVLPFMRGLADSTFGSRLDRAILRAGVERWPRIWHNMRATRQTELEELYPTHVVCAWLGNSEATARKHYLKVTDDHFKKAAHKAAQHTSARTGTEGKAESEHAPETL